MEIIPAIDIIDGKCVRLTQGDFTQATIYDTDPVDVAQRFEDAGLRSLHMVDLDGAKCGKLTNLTTLKRVANKTNLKIDFGGGIKTDEDLEAIFDSGAKVATVGSVAVRDPDKLFRWAEIYGSEKFLVGADVRDGKLAVDGWQTGTNHTILPFLDLLSANGISRVFVTDIAMDGLMAGPSISLYKEILAAAPQVDLIASGGVGSMRDIMELKAAGCSGAIVGKAIYERAIELEELAEYAG